MEAIHSSETLIATTSQSITSQKLIFVVTPVIISDPTQRVRAFSFYRLPCCWILGMKILIDMTNES
jgi:hypothetical protein